MRIIIEEGDGRKTIIDADQGPRELAEKLLTKHLQRSLDRMDGNCSRLRGRKRFAVEIPCLVVPPQEAE